MLQISIPDGGKLIYQHTDKFKSEYFTANFILPLSHDTVTAYALLPSLLCRGSQKYPTQQLLSRRCEELYSLSLSADVRKCGEMLVLTFIVSTVSDSYISYAFKDANVLSESIKLLGEILCDPYLPNGKFDETYLLREKEELADTLRSRIDSKSAYCLEKAIDAMCCDEPFGIKVGYEEDLESITSEQLVALHRNMLSEVMPIYTYVGEKSYTEVRKCISGGLPLGGDALHLTVSKKADVPKEVKLVTERLDISQSKVAMGFRMSKTLLDDDFYKFSLFSALFGDSPTSRLFANVREKKSLCYYCRPIGYTLKGIYFVTAGIEKHNRDALISAVEEQLDDIKSGNISDDELAMAKKALKNSYNEIFDSAAAISAWYFNRFLAGRSDSPEESAGKLDSVTKREVAEMASSLMPDTYFVLEG